MIVQRCAGKSDVRHVTHALVFGLRRKQVGAAGEVVTLIGESGSGKSTIGKMILQLLTITSGSILFNGVDISTLGKSKLKAYCREIQGVFQDPFSSYNPIFKADRIIKIVHDEFNPETKEAEWIDRVDAALKVVGLNPDTVLNKYPHQLSGGQLQRFLIARALLLDIQFLVADEIISMLDASTRIVADKALGCDIFRPMLIEAEPDHYVVCFRFEEGTTAF